MECVKWQELGLLFLSGELNDRETAEYEEHRDSCSVCREAEKDYNEYRSSFFTDDILGDAPSAACDKEILRVCSQTAIKPTAVGMIPFMARKALVPVFFLILGTGVGVYFFFVSNSVRNESIYQTINNPPPGTSPGSVGRQQRASVDEQLNATGSVAVINDSAGQNSIDTNYPGEEAPRLSAPGIPVDINKE